MSGTKRTSSSGRTDLRWRWRGRSFRAKIITALAVFALAVAGLAVGTTPAVAAGPTVVTLTFDDGNADQMNAAQILNNNGLKGTFFVPSGVIGTPNYMTLANLQGLAAAGHEIGGHSVTHPDLTTLTTDEATRQVCNDRVNLTNWGFRVTNFAYPFAAANAAVESIVRNCGYNSARGLGDIKTRFSCATCPLAETIPPANPYYTAAPDQQDTSWTLADLQTSVTQAEAGGGWVQLTFHHVAASSTDPLNVTPAVLSQFVTWLKARPATTSVQTVNQVIGGTVKPVVPGPAVPPPATSGNLVKNPSLETLVSGGAPQCWQQGGYGTNTAAFRTVSPGRTGRVAERLTVTGYANGDAKFLPALDLGGCSPGAVAGHTYNIAAWYKSTAVTQFALYYRTGVGSWTYWTSSPWFSPATTFQKASWTTPAVPAGANGISFGLNLFSNGTLTTDDYEMFDSATATAPPPPPSGTNLVQNAGLETAGAGAPQCWQTAGYGTNTAAFSTVTAAHGGVAASRLAVSAYSSGDAKLLQTMDSGSCAPPAIAGHTYSLRAWYNSTAVTQFTVYYRNSAGTWVYWTSSPWLAATSSYTQARFTTPALPAGATAISFGLNIFSNGTLVTDDYAMYDTVGAPAL